MSMDFKFRDNIMNKIRNQIPLEQNELRTVENALTMDELFNEVLDESLGWSVHGNIFNLSTSMSIQNDKYKAKMEN
jgi:hypothetical protein